MVSARGGKYGFVYTSRQATYRDLREKGMSKSKAARISNAGRTRAGRSKMAKRGALHRKAHAHRTGRRR
jgi:transcriptional regulator